MSADNWPPHREPVEDEEEREKELERIAEQWAIETGWKAPGEAK